MSSQSFRIGAIILSLLFLFSLQVFGQAAARLFKGVVTDETDAVIPGARLVLERAEGKRFETLSLDDGSFDFGFVEVGKYRLTVVKSGFKDIVREVSVDDELSDPSLKMTTGAVAETVTIVMDGADLATESTLKLPVSLHQTPRSLSVVGAERIREQNFRQVSDVLNYVPGTSQNSFRNGSYHFYSRGYRMLPDDTRLDGFGGVNVGSGGFGASMFGIEEAVVLRGPAGLVYGSSGAPGGFINLISKKPRADYFTRVDLRGGGYNGNGVSFGERPSVAVDVDSTGRLFRSDRVMYRGLATVENTNYFTRDTRDRNQYLNGSLTFLLDEGGRFQLTPTVQWTRYYRPYGGGIVVSPTSSLRTNDGLSNLNRDDLSPLDVNLSAGRRIEETAWAALDFRGIVSDKLRVGATYRYISFDTDINSFTPQVTSNAQIAALQTQNVVSRVQSKSLTQRNYHNVSADATYEWKSTGWWRNTSQIGFYERLLDSRATSATGAIPTAQSPINIYTGVAATPLIDNFPAIRFGVWGRDRVWNGFFQNRTSLAGGRVNVTLGLNYGQNRAAGGAVRKSDVMPNLSVVVNPTQTLALYASYSTSYNPADPDIEDAQGNRGAFSPTIGKNYEVGAKVDMLDRRVGLAFALFSNRIENALVQSDVNVVNPRGNRFYVAAGTRRARGAELTGEFQVRTDLRISTGISFLDAVYKGFPGGLATGGGVPLTSPIPNSRAEKTPRWSGNVYARYDRREGFLKGFGAGLGVVYQAKRLGSNGARTFSAPDPLVLPSFVKVDSALFYRLNKFVNFAVNVDNLFDEVIFVNASVGSSIEIASPRTTTFRTTFNF